MIDKNLLQQTSNPADIQNNYVTGGPGNGYVNSVLDKYMGPKTLTASPSFGVGNTRLADVPSGPRYPYYYPTLGLEGNEELYAQGQSWYGKAFNAVGKGVGLAATTLLNGTVGMLVGTTNAITDGKFSSFYDNDFSRSLDDFNKMMEDELPNYYTQAEQNSAWYSPTNLFTANFLFDKVIKNMGYAAGALGSGAAYAAAIRSLGLFTKIASAGGLARTASMSEDVLANVQAGQRAGAIENGMKSIAKDFVSSYNLLNRSQRAITAGLGTLGEASFEALQSTNEFRDRLIQEHVERTGTEPDTETLSSINEMAERVGNTTFGLNVALLSATNYIQFPKILGSSYRAERKLFNDSVEEIGKISRNAEGKFVAGSASRVGKAIDKTRNALGLLFSPSEAFEEGSQTALQFGVNNYYNKAYQNKDADLFSDLFGEGIKHTLTSKEGIESILIGGISGGLMESPGAIKKRGVLGTSGTRGGATAAAIDAFNRTTLSGYMRDNTDSVNRGTVIQQQRASAIRRGDFQEARDLEYDYAHNYLTPRIKYGRFDLVMDDIDRYRQLSSTNEGWTQLQEEGVIDADATPEEFRRRLSNMESHAKNASLMYQSLNTRYGSMLDSNGNRRYSPEVIDKMVYAGSKVADYDQRMLPLNNSLMVDGINSQAILDSLNTQDVPSTQATQDALNQINNLDVISERKDTLRNNLRDLIEMSLRRKAFIREYDKIKNDPSRFQEEELIPSDTSSVPVPQEIEPGRFRNRQFELGRQYEIASPILREDNRLTVLPTVTLHERNALGEIRATTPTGEDRFIQPSDLRGYTLQDTPIFDRDIAEKKFTESLESVLARNNVPVPEGTLQEKLNVLGTPENSDLIDKIEAAFQRDLEELRAVQAEIDNLRRNAERLKELNDIFNQIVAEAGTVSTGDPELDIALIQTSLANEGQKKKSNILFSSTTSPDTSKGETENNNFHRRANKFLNNIDKMRKPDELKAILVTTTNQASLGLNGFIPESSTDVDEGTIRTVFIRSTPTGDFFVDENGDNMVKLGETPNFNSLIYSTMPNTSINWRNGDPRYITIGPNAITEAEARAIASNWRAKREQILKEVGYTLYDFTRSRGIPNSRTGERNPVTQSLIRPSDLNSPVIVVPTQSTGPDSKVALVAVGEELYPYPVGRPILVKGGMSTYLNNRKLTDNEKDTVKRSIIEFAKNPKRSDISTYLKGILYWGRPKGTPNSNQIWYDEGKLFLGSTDTSVPFVASALEVSQDLDRFLNNAYTNVNNFLLTQRKGVFNEIIKVNDDSTVDQVEWKSYQHYLLSPIYDTTEFDNSGLGGKPRTDIPLTTNIVTTNDPYYAPFEQVYAKLSGLDMVPVAAKPPVVEAPKTPVAPAVPETDTTNQEFEPITQAGDFILDGRTMNLVDYNGNKIMNIAALWTDDGIQVIDVEWLLPEAIYKGNEDTFLTIAISQISKAVLIEAQRMKDGIIATPETEPAQVVTPPSIPQDPSPTVTKKPSDLYKNLRPPESGSTDFRMITDGPYKIEDIKAFGEWMDENLPSIPVHTVENLIEMTGNGYAWGVFQDNAIYIYQNAEIGTGYHEAFEAVYNAFLTNKEQAEILKEFKRRSGTFTDRETGRSTDYSSASDHQAKEQMAEEFREYKLNGTIYTPRETGFFRRLINFIVEAIFGGKITSLFNKINTGYFANKPIIQRNVAAQPRIVGFNTKFVHEAMQGMTVRIFQELFKDNRNIVAFDETNPLSKEVFDKLYGQLEKLYTNDIPYMLNQYLEESKITGDAAEEYWAEHVKFETEVWGSISKNWDQFVRANKEFLKPFSIIFTSEDDVNEVSSNENPTNSDDKNMVEYDRDILKIDAKKNASTAVKLLFATLTDVNPVANPVDAEGGLITPQEKWSDLKLPVTVRYAATFNRFLHEVSNTNGLDNILRKVKTLATKDQRFIRLYKRLRANKDYQNLSIDDWKLLMKLYTVASKQKPDYLIQVTDNAGSTYIANANDNTQTRVLMRKWLNNLKGAARNGRLVYIKDGVYQVNVDELRKYNMSQLTDRFKFASDIGFTFTQEMYNNLKPYNKTKFNNSVRNLHSQLSKSGEIGAITNRALGISSAMNALAEIAVTSTGDDSNSQHFNIEGEPVQNFILNNYVSTILNDINAYETRDQLLEALPHLKDTFSQDSLLLKRDGVIFDNEGNRREEALKVVIVEGSTVTSNSGSKGVSTSNLSIAPRRLQEFNQNIKEGVYYILLPADSKTEWSLRTGHYIDWSAFENKGALANRVNKIFRDYLRTEILLAQDAPNRIQVTNLQKAGKHLRFFKDILSEPLVTSVQEVIDSGVNPDGWLQTNQEKIQADVNDWIKNKVDAQIDHFREYNIIRNVDTLRNEWTFNGLDSDFVNAADLPKMMTESQMRDIVRFRTLNYVINNIELHKVFFGDPALYKDATKRIKSFLSGRETSYHTDPYFNTFANESLNYAGEVALSPTDPGYHIFKDYMNTATVRDIEVVGSIALNDTLTPEQIDPESKEKIYGKTNEADAQSWATLQAYREMLFKAGGRWSDAQERQYQYEMAYERNRRSLRRDKYQYTYPASGALQEHDDRLLALGSPSDTETHPEDFYIIKPIGTGQKLGSTFLDAFLDKTSTMPIFYRLAEGRQMEEIYIQMQAQDKSYLIAISGRKVGAEKLHSMYTEDGSINQEAFNNNIQIPFKYWGIQVETGSHKDKQTKGSQATKIATIDLLSNRVPVDVSMSFEEWAKLTEEEKRKASNIWPIIQRNRGILEAMSNKGYRAILDKLNIIEDEDGFRIDDYQKVVDYINREIKRRELPENIQDAVSVDPSTGQFTIPLEALNNYKILKNIIYSIVDKNLLSPKVSGGPKVQVSSTLFERNKRQAVYRKDNKWEKVTDYEALSDAEKKTVRLTSSELKFYTPEEPWMEVLMPHWFKKEIQKARARNKELPLRTDEEILDYLNKNKSELLKVIGFRIPTQALSSIENIRIKGFLPQEFGNSIVVPSEITSKAGSDFDIDKLNTYLKNFRINKEGYPEYIRYDQFDASEGDIISDKGIDQAYDKFFGRIDSFLQGAYDQLDELYYRDEDPEVDPSVNSLIDSIFQDMSLESDLKEVGINEERFKKAVDKYIPIEKFRELTTGKTVADVYGMFDPKALENRYYETLNDLLSLPQNFKRLIQPNSAKELEDLRDELLEAKGLEKSDVKGNYSVLLDPMFVSQVRHNFISGKGGVGIAAVQQTNNALNQGTTIVVNHRNFRSKLNPLERAMVQDTVINLPRNTIEFEGEVFTTLSSILDRSGRYISDKISSYINGFVDVAKDAFIIELGADLNVASTYMFLEKIGVPTRDVIFFMNQPIIRELLKAMQIRGVRYPNTWTVQKTIADNVRAMFPAKAPRTGPLNTRLFKGYIERYYKTKERFSEEDNAEQLQILDEFFKYYVMSSHLFKLTQGSNYDTANFNEPALIYRKQRATQNARDNSILSSVDRLLNSSFIGNIADKLVKVKGALGTIFKLDTPSVSNILEDVMDPYLAPDKFISEKDFLGITTKIQSSFIDWITQTLGEGRLNTKIKPLLMDMDTSVANQLYRLKTTLPEDSDILQNPVLQALEASFDNSYSSEVKVVQMTQKAYDAYTSNMFTDAFRELRDNPHTRDLYLDLVTASVIQSGIRKSLISFTDLIPVEDYSPIISRIMQNLESTPDLVNFRDLHVFQRNNWTDDQVVPSVKLKVLYTDGPEGPDEYTPAYHVPPALSKIEGATGITFLKLHSLFNSRDLGYPVIKVTSIRINPETDEEYNKTDQERMRKRGDYSFQTYRLYTPVMVTEADGTKTALTIPDSQRPGQYFILYKIINAWGSPGKVQEYYSTGEKSILPSNVKVTEIEDSVIINALSKPITQERRIQDQANEQKYKEDYLEYEDVTGETEDVPDLTDEDIRRINEGLKDSGDATTTDC